MIQKEMDLADRQEHKARAAVGALMLIPPNCNVMVAHRLSLLIWLLQLHVWTSGRRVAASPKPPDSCAEGQPQTAVSSCPINAGVLQTAPHASYLLSPERPAEAICSTGSWVSGSL